MNLHSKLVKVSYFRLNHDIENLNIKLDSLSVACTHPKANNFFVMLLRNILKKTKKKEMVENSALNYSNIIVSQNLPLVLGGTVVFRYRNILVICSMRHPGNLSESSFLN